MTWMTVIAGTTALVLLSSTLTASAQGQGSEHRHGQSAVPSRNDFSASVNTDLASFKEALRLTPEQEKNWPAFESAVRDLVKFRLDRAADRRDQPLPATPVERLRRNADGLRGTAAALTRLAEAAEPFYASLDDEQRQRFVRLSSIVREQVAMLEGSIRDRSEPTRDGRGSEGRDGRDGSRYGDDDTGQREGGAKMHREMMRMYRDMMRMHGEMMRRRGDYEDRRGWRERQSDRWNDRDDGRRMQGWGGRERYDDYDR